MGQRAHYPTKRFRLPAFLSYLLALTLLLFPGALTGSTAPDSTEVGVSGTPGFFINGRFLSGAQPFDAFRRVIDRELGNG